MFGLIGRHIGGSFSARWFGERGVDYRNFELSRIDQLPAILRENPSLRGFNVTSPYKEEVIPFLDSLSETAVEVGAVNCVECGVWSGGSQCAAGNLAAAPSAAMDSRELPQSVILSEAAPRSKNLKGTVRLIGHNTDAPALFEVIGEYVLSKRHSEPPTGGVESASEASPCAQQRLASLAQNDILFGRCAAKGSLRSQIPRRLSAVLNDAPPAPPTPSALSALILGSRGAARAAAWALRRLGIEYTVVSRRGGGENVISYADLTADIVAANALIINASPVGMAACPGRPDIPYDALTQEHLLFDMIYNPPETEFLLAGRQRGARTLNGLSMLIRQAELSAEIWGI